MIPKIRITSKHLRAWVIDFYLTLFIILVKKKGPLATISRKLTATMLVTLVILSLLLLSFLFYQTKEKSGIQVNVSPPKPITSLKSQEIYGSYNANADVIVFSHLEAGDDHYALSLMAKSVTEERYALLTNTDITKNGDYHAEISPSGNRMVFNRSNLTTQCDFMLADFDAAKLRLSNIKSIMKCPEGAGGLKISWRDEENLYLTYSHTLDTPRAIYRMALYTRELFPLTQVVHTKGHGDYSFAYSKLVNKIAYLRDVTGVNNTELWVVDLTNNSHTRLTTLNNIPYSVVWVNQGKHLIVRSGHSELSIVDMNGVSSVFEDKIKSPFYNPFSINDTTIAFMAGEFYIYDLYVMDLNENKTDFTLSSYLSSSFSDYRPVMAKLNKTLAFVSKRNGRFQIWLSNKTGLSQLTHFKSPIAIQALAMSPNGNLLAYYADGIVTLIDDTGKQLFVNSSYASNPTFSLDGKYLYFETENMNISRLDLNSFQLTPFFIRGTIPRAGANGSLYYIQDRKLFRLSSAGGILVIGPLPEAARIWKSEHYDVIGDQLYYTKRINNALKLVRRTLSGGEDTVIAELFTEGFSLNSDASLMISSRPQSGETNLEMIELTFP